MGYKYTHQNKVAGKDGKTYGAKTSSRADRAQRNEDIRQAYATGKSQARVAAEFGVAKSVVWKAVHGAAQSKPTNGGPSSMKAQLDFRKKFFSDDPYLTRDQVDPEFKGTPIDFVDKYGHIQVETAEKRATGRFSDWAIEIGHLAKTIQKKTMPEVDTNWLRSPRKADIERLTSAMEVLRPIMKRAEELLERAVEKEKMPKAG